jgi:hypothetical protein
VHDLAHPRDQFGPLSGEVDLRQLNVLHPASCTNDHANHRRLMHEVNTRISSIMRTSPAGVGLSCWPLARRRLQAEGDRAQDQRNDEPRCERQVDRQPAGLHWPQHPPHRRDHLLRPGMSQRAGPAHPRRAVGQHPRLVQHQPSDQQQYERRQGVPEQGSDEAHDELLRGGRADRLTGINGVARSEVSPSPCSQPTIRLASAGTLGSSG